MEQTASNSLRPLIVDLDGTLSRVDTLHESFLGSLQESLPYTLKSLAATASHGKGAIKDGLSQIAIPDAKLLPYRQEVLEKIHAHRQAGGRVILATGAHQRIAESVAAHLGCFDEVHATNAQRNLIGPAKAELLISLFGEGNFDYIGDSKADIPVWKAAKERWVVGSDSRAASLSKLAAVPLNRLEPQGIQGKAPWKILRPHQWAKNMLVALPVLSSHKFTDPHLLANTLLIFAAFSSTASLVYLGNDLFDRESDRKNPSKARRPIASGRLSIPAAMLMMIALVACSSLLSMFLPWQASAGLGAYLAANLAYTLHFKRRLLIDVFLLAFMYVWRIAVGAFATGIALSGWLLGFSVFLFLSLALAKRYAEVVRLESSSKKAAGRAWKPEDAPFLAVAGIACGVAGAIVLALYVTGDSFSKLYASPELVTALSPLFLYWIMRLWIQATRQELHEDPVLFAAKDKVSYLVGVCATIILAIASIHF